MDLLFIRFVHSCAAACDVAPAEAQSLLMTDEDDVGLLVAEIPFGAPPESVQEAAAQVFVGNKPYGAMATRTNWSPDNGPSSDAWCCAAVKPGEPAQFIVKRIAEDDSWWSIPRSSAPWFLLSIAASLRDMLKGKPIVVKYAKDHRLFRAPGQGPVPPVDDQGLI